MMNAFLLDDEPHCTDVLRVMLERHCPEIRMAGIFNDPELALEALAEIKPDLLFLDIEMPRLNGFDFLQRCGNFPMQVIFTTAYDQYAVRAFKFSALDYLLKPIHPDELKQAVQKALQATSIARPEQLDIARYLKTAIVPERIGLPVGQELILLDVAEILYCASDGSYVTFHVTPGIAKNDRITVSKSLREIEELLNNPGFFRVHHSYLVNLKRIRKIIRSDGGQVVLTDGSTLPVARGKKAELLGVIERL